MKFPFFTLLLVLLISCDSKQADIEQDLPKKADVEQKIEEIQKQAVYSYQTFETEGLGWGYAIFKEGKKMLNQPHIPAIQGNKGFEDEKDAAIVAQFVLQKVEEGNFPPTITVDEMTKLGVKL